MIRAAEFGVALTFVIVLSYGLVSLRDTSTYTANTTRGGQTQSQKTLTASAANAFDWLISGIEKLVAPQIDYVRVP